MNAHGLKAAFGAGLFFIFSSLLAQGTFPDLVDHAYGLDKDLVNGIQYYNMHLHSMGHPYLQQDRFVRGSVSIKGKSYDQLWLKYDLLRQKVVLEYEAFSGGDNQLITVFDHVDSFSLGDLRFQKMEIGESGPTFYQVIPFSHFSCLVHWEKKLIPLHNNTTYVDQFTKSRRTFWISGENQTEQFHNRKTFAGYFPPDQQKAIRKLLRQRSISFRQATPAEIVRAMDGVATFLTEESIP